MFKTFVIRPCMTRKVGLLTFNWTERKRSATLLLQMLTPFTRYRFFPPTTTFMEERKKSCIFWHQLRTTIIMRTDLKNAYLSGHDDGIIAFVSDRRVILVRVVEGDGHAGLRNTGLAILVHQILETASSHLVKNTNRMCSGLLRASYHSIGIK